MKPSQHTTTKTTTTTPGPRHEVPGVHSARSSKRVSVARRCGRMHDTGRYGGVLLDLQNNNFGELINQTDGNVGSHFSHSGLTCREPENMSSNK